MNVRKSLFYAIFLGLIVRPLLSPARETFHNDPDTLRQYGILLGPAKNRFAAIPEPYPDLNGGSYIDPRVPESLDPLITYRWETTSASDGLQIYSLRPIAAATNSPASFENLSSLATDSPMVTVKGPGSIRVDFGVESAAWLELESDDLAGAVDMSISEYNQPAVVNSGPENPVKRKAPVKYGDVYRLELNRDLYEGVRFGWVHVVSFGQAWHIKGLRLVCQVKPANYNGSFRCSDTALTRIWYTGAYVVKLNLLKDYFGAILMDRGDRHSWTGDAHPSQAASMAAFGNFDFVRANIERTAADDNGIESYSLYWILSLVDYYMVTDDGTTLAKHIATVERKLDHAAAIYDSATANLGFFGWDERLGAGFENPGISENRRAYRMLYVRACRGFSRAMDFAGNAALRDKYAGLAKAKEAALRADAQWYKSFGLHSLADALNAGIADAAEKAAIFQQAFSDPRERWSYSPFNQYFVIRALSEMGRDDAALETAKDYWGGQLDYGGTTFFEVYRPDWNQELKLNDPVPNSQCGYTSLAHPWGAGVTRWLSDTVLGIRPIKPGFETFDILPHLGSRLTSVAGKVPTPRGTIEAAFDVTSGICSITVPGGTSGRVGIPKVGRTVGGISVNGSVVWNGQYVPVAGIGGAEEDAEFVYLTAVQPGTYALSVAYGGSPKSTVEAASPFAAEFLGVDGSTRGSWRGVYGKDGYILCNYYGNGTAAISLPIYVRSVTFGKSGAVKWAAGTADGRALEPPPDGGAGGSERTAAAVLTQDPLPTYQTMTVDIQTDPASSAVFRIGLYFVDWDNAGRTSAVEMFDGESLSLISPLKIVKDYAGGKYLIYRYHKSCRIRINQVRGTNAVLSGIFFDSDPREALLRLSRTGAAFGCVEGTALSGRQAVAVGNGGLGRLMWQAAADQPWLKVLPTAGGQSESFQTWVDPAGLSAGSYLGRILVSAGGAVNSPQAVNVTLQVYAPGTDALPFGSFETPVDGSTGVTGAIPVTGWALDDLEVTKVEIWRDPVAGESVEANAGQKKIWAEGWAESQGKNGRAENKNEAAARGGNAPGGLVYIGDATLVEGARPDIERLYPGYPWNYRPGWGYMLLTNFLPGLGNGTYKLTAIATDKAGHSMVLGTKTISCDNAHAVKPFGTIDTPGQGGTASGRAYNNFGWALTPLPNAVPTDGSTIHVWVDGVPLGRPLYNNYRADIASKFPGLANSSGAVGVYAMDTTQLAEGVHTVAWSVQDSAGNVDGIGSRFFNVVNAGAAGVKKAGASAPVEAAGQGRVGSANVPKEERFRNERFQTGAAGDNSIGLSVSFYSILNMPVRYEPVGVRFGYDLGRSPIVFQPDYQGLVKLEIREVERVEIDLESGGGRANGAAVYRGVLVVGTETRPPPIGSALDAGKGVFSWMPGPGFLGEFDFVFLKADARGMNTRIPVKIIIKPRTGV